MKQEDLLNNSIEILLSIPMGMSDEDKRQYLKDALEMYAEYIYQYVAFETKNGGINV